MAHIILKAVKKPSPKNQTRVIVIFITYTHLPQLDIHLAAVIIILIHRQVPPDVPTVVEDAIQQGSETQCCYPVHVPSELSDVVPFDG